MWLKSAVIAVVVLTLPSNTTLSEDTELSLDILDWTCVNNGTRKRIAIIFENNHNLVPCSVQYFEHPLGKYTMNWKIIPSLPKKIKRADELTEDDQYGFCLATLLNTVNEHKEDDWGCYATSEWNRRGY